MSNFRYRYTRFGRGLYVGGLGAGVGLIIFWAVYLWVLATRGPLTAMIWFHPGFSMTAILQSLVFVTAAGIFGRQNISILRVVVYSCLSIPITLIVQPATSIGMTARKLMLLKNPLFEMDYVAVIFAINVTMLAIGFAFAPSRSDCLQNAQRLEISPQ